MMDVVVKAKNERSARWGRNIRLARENCKHPDGSSWSQQDLANALRVTQATISRWEAGSVDPPDDRRFEIADVLRSDAQLLFPLYPVRRAS